MNDKGLTLLHCIMQLRRDGLTEWLYTPLGYPALPIICCFLFSKRGGGNSFKFLKAFGHEIDIRILLNGHFFKILGTYFSTIVLRKIKTRHTLKKALVVIQAWGTGHATKSDEFSQRFQRQLTPPLRMVHISRNHVHAFHCVWPSQLLAHMQPYQLKKKIAT